MEERNYKVFNIFYWTLRFYVWLAVIGFPFTLLFAFVGRREIQHAYYLGYNDCLDDEDEEK